uniref:Uncharacterized protein n=1 Tax=Arundo donax TaxID=35708 RepID=A0A0A9G2I0_ARUDO
MFVLKSFFLLLHYLVCETTFMQYSLLHTIY